MVAFPLLSLRIRPVIVLFGDSITQQGYGWNDAAAASASAASLGWTALLSNAYQRRADVLARGYSGYNTRMALDLLPSIAPQPAVVPGQSRQQQQGTAAEAEVLFVAVFFGANDAALPGERQHVPLEEYGDNLVKIVRHLRNSTVAGNPTATDVVDGSCEASTPAIDNGGDKGDSDMDSSSVEQHEFPIILMTPPPVDADAWYAERGEPSDPERRNDRANDNARAYGQKVKEVAATFGRNCSVLDVFDLLGGNGPVELYGRHLRDGLHLSPSGNELLYRGLIKLIEDEYPQLAPMTEGEGKYGTTGIPLEENLWREMC